MKATAFVMVLLLTLLSTAALAEEGATDLARAERSRPALVQGTRSNGPKADVPGLMSYQGTLTDDAGIALDTIVSVTFKMYDADVGGSVLWTETQPAVEVNAGIFNVLLGEVNPLTASVFSGADRWLGVQVGGDPELDPRQRIGTVAYAFQSGGDGDWTISGSNIYSAVPGNVGIGTSSPASKLDVSGEINTSSFYKIGGSQVLSVTGTQNTFVGLGAGENNTSGYGTFVGYNAGYNNQGQHNTFLGRWAGYANTTGQRNIFIGSNAGRENSTGESNVYVGYEAGRLCTTGVYNVFLGYRAGYYESGSNKLYIDNTLTASPLVYGEFDNNILAINGNMGIGTTNPGQPLDVVGDVHAGGGSGDYDGDQEFILLRGRSDDWYVGVENEVELDSTDFFIGKAVEDGMFHIQNGGNVGIGTTNPGAKLEVIASVGSAVHAEGDTFGIEAYGNRGGGYFEDASGFPAYAYLGMDSRGIHAVGMTSGGLFEDYDASGYATVGSGNYGIQAYGDNMGGRFVDLNSTGLAYIASGDRGIEAFGDVGGYFEGLNDTTTTYICYGSMGISATGPYAGGAFYDYTSGAYCHVARSSYKMYGSGTPSFVQNHPYDSEKVIVYAAPEGDEAATYTRGTARLVDGQARVPLGETFKWVTNPDIGLTAHLTPRSQAVPLAVVSLTTEELVVRGPEDGPADLVFDYIVYGLRIGFEEISIVQEKTQESYIPSMADHRDRYDRYPELRKYNSLERFARMQSQIGTVQPLDLAASRALRDAIVEFNPVIHGAAIPERLEGEETEIFDEGGRSARERVTRGER